MDTGGNKLPTGFHSSFTTTVNEVANTIIADHTVVDEYDQIPQQYIDAVKQMLLCIPGESHGRGFMYGLERLEAQDARFAVNITWSGAPEGYTDQHLRAVRTYWTGSSWSSSGGEEDFFTNQAAIDEMKNHLSYMKNTASNPLSAFGFGWCWDMTWHNSPGGTVDPVYGVRWAGSSVGGPDGDLRWGIDDGDTALTGNSVNLYTYIDAVVAYNAHEPDAVTFFTTGPVDGYTGESGYQRYVKHEEIRNYVQDNGGVLFDYADILCWDDSGGQNTTTWDGHTYQRIVSAFAEEWDGGQGSSHVSEAGCLRLGKAMWWMLARMAGWSGV
jgi:hypothetical protein